MTLPGRASVLSCLVLLFAAPGLLRAQTGNLEVRPADREVLTQQPRDVVAMSFMVRNGTGRRIDIEPRLVLPEGWRLVTPELPFTLGNADTAVRMVSFMIPETARAGEYPVTYAVQDRLQPIARGSYTIRVNVMPSQKLQVLPLESAGFAISGESYRSAFLLRNVGNAPIAAEFKIHSIHGSEPTPQTGKLQIEPGEAQTVEVDVATPTLYRRADEHLTLTAAITGTEIRDSATTMTQIVPRRNINDAYHTLATQLDLALIGRDIDAERSSAWQIGWSGSGYLDAENTRHLGFRLRGPDTRDYGSFGGTDDYSLSYSDPNRNATVGDDTYGLSLLTEPGRYGRGLGVGYRNDGMGISGFHAKDRFAFVGREQSGFNAYFQSSPATRLDINLLETRGGSLPATMRSMSSQTRWNSNLTTTFEVADSEGAGERGQAMRTDLYGTHQSLRYYAVGWHAEPGYRGYLRDQQYLTTGFDFARDQGMGVHGYYRFQRHNLDEDPEDPAPQEQQINFGVDRRLTANLRATLDYNLRTYVDYYTSIATAPVDIQNRSGRLGLSQSYKNLSILYSVERGKTQSRISDLQFDTTLHLLSAHWRATAAQSYGIYAMRDDNTHSREPQGIQTTFGLNASYDLESTVFRFDAQRNYDVQDLDELQIEYDTQSHYDTKLTRRYDSYSLQILHQLRNGDRISLLGRHLKGQEKQTEVLLAYTLPFALPIFRRANVATVTGRIYDAETGVGMRNIVLNLDGLTAVTGSDGEFEFPAVAAGSYQLAVDRSNIDVDKVPLANTPLAIAVGPHDAKRLDVALVRSVTINVDVTLHTNGNGINGSSAAKPATIRGLQNVLVTLRNGDHVFHRLTDADGRARLAGLPPGEWTASISSDSVPEGYGLTSRELVLDVPPGSSVSAEFPMTLITREIKMLPALKIN